MAHIRMVGRPSRALILSRFVAPLGARGYAADAMTLLQEVDDEEYRVEALENLCHNVPDLQWESLLLEPARFHYDVYRARALKAIAARAPERCLQATLHSILEMPADQPRIDALRVVGPRLSGVLLTHALEAARETDVHWRAESIVALCAAFRGEAFPLVPAILAARPDPQERVSILLFLLPDLSGDHRDSVAAIAVDALNGIQNEEQRAQATQA